MYYCCVLLRFNNSNKRPFPTEYSELQQFLNSENVPARVSWSLRRATPLALFRRWFFDESFSECYAIASWSNTIIFIDVIITLNKLDQLAEWPIVWERRTKALSHTRGGGHIECYFYGYWSHIACVNIIIIVNFYYYYQPQNDNCHHIPRHIIPCDESYHDRGAWGGLEGVQWILYDYLARQWRGLEDQRGKRGISPSLMFDDLMILYINISSSSPPSMIVCETW